MFYMYYDRTILKTIFTLNQLIYSLTVIKIILRLIFLSFSLFVFDPEIGLQQLTILPCYLSSSLFHHRNDHLGPSLFVAYTPFLVFSIVLSPSTVHPGNPPFSMRVRSINFLISDNTPFRVLLLSGVLSNTPSLITISVPLSLSILR